MSDKNSEGKLIPIKSEEIDQITLRIGGYITQPGQDGDVKFLVLTLWVPDTNGELVQIINEVNGQKIAAHVLCQPFIVPRKPSNPSIILPPNGIIH